MGFIYSFFKEKEKAEKDAKKLGNDVSMMNNFLVGFIPVLENKQT